MTSISIERRPLYGIGTVARLTGIKADTLRIWERRYGLGASHKSGTGRRQYTQSDLEHLQLVSKLVTAGARIGEIASSPRKTLEIMLRRESGGKIEMPRTKPRVGFVGHNLCAWLDEHQGCITRADALLVRHTLPDLSGSEPGGSAALGELDALVLECPSLTASAVAQVDELIASLGVRNVIIVYQFGSEGRLKRWQEMGYKTHELPLDAAYLAYELSLWEAECSTSQGDADLGELLARKPRQFDQAELLAAAKLEKNLDCECPRHISTMIQALNEFEEYSTNCSSENWHEAAVHACIYAYTSQARWLMEKALSASLEGHEETLSEVS
ncbi:MAG: MerR family transcriptional regulator [Pseudomonadota bacterium]